jgi:hypothetical protein
LTTIETGPRRSIKSAETIDPDRNVTHFFLYDYQGICRYMRTIGYGLKGKAVAVRPGSSVTSGGEFGGGGFHGDVFSLKLSRTPPITGRGREAFYRTLPNANGRIGEREKGASEKRRDDVHEEDLHDGHAWKHHSLAKSAQR